MFWVASQSDRIGTLPRGQATPWGVPHPLVSVATGVWGRDEGERVWDQALLTSHAPQVVSLVIMRPSGKILK